METTDKSTHAAFMRDEGTSSGFTGVAAAARIIVAVLLLSATGRHPHGFYELLRRLTCGALAFSAYDANLTRKHV